MKKLGPSTAKILLKTNKGNLAILRCYIYYIILYIYILYYIYMIIYIKYTTYRDVIYILIYIIYNIF